jgi:hypothetical protein
MVSCDAKPVFHQINLDGSRLIYRISWTSAIIHHLSPGRITDRNIDTSDGKIVGEDIIKTFSAVGVSTTNFTKGDSSRKHMA